MTPGGRGVTTIADRAVRKIAERAAHEAVAPSGGAVLDGEASVRHDRAVVSLRPALPYGGSADAAARDVQRHVATRTAHLTGLLVPSPRVGVRELTAPAGSAPADAGPEADPADREPGRVRGRPWSERCGPTVLLASAVLGCAAAVGSVRHPFAVLDGHVPIDVHGSNGAAAWLGGALALLGLWSLVLAVTPGRRRDLVLTTDGCGARAVIDRRSAGRLVGAAVTQVPGIGNARVRMGRRRLRVRAALAFGDPDPARALVAEATAAAVADLGLRRAARTRVTVHR
ncbi:DUF6286 domain-containing Asp23/Gls24 family envelope stress response protein [Streptomyces sp. NPDC101733]|uniref:DUF6286 domain-containing Asp23/Gls24 family envelope stress response protein n=1 Tax=unclassified Streptomyces TaxID=2593676 RepID=UPI0038077AC7